MSFTGDHYTVETFAPDRADQSLCIRILPWRSRRGWMIADTHRIEALEEGAAVDTIAITDQVPWCFLPRDCFGYTSIGEAVFRALALPFRDFGNRDEEPTIATVRRNYEQTFQA